MASVSADRPKLKKKNLPKIESAVYATTTLTEQVVFAIHLLQQHGVAVSVEEVVSACFRLFPQSFSLKHYTRWPDSALVIRRLNDAREKGFVKGSPQDGFALNYKGLKLAERTARVLGLVRETPPKKKVVLSKIKTTRPRPVEKASKVVPKPQPKTVTAKRDAEAKPAAPKKGLIRTVVEAPVIKRALAKLHVVKTKAPKKTAPTTTALQRPAAEKKLKDIPVAQKADAQSTSAKNKKDESRSAQPAQGTAQAKQPAGQPVKKAAARKNTAPQLTKLQAIQPEIILPSNVAKSAPMLVVSKEEKIKAEKIVRAMERSDAYKIYGKNGHAARLSEFDFRNMLFATMESTPETLIRNVNLFKGSAAIHNRQDLIKFLDYCETNFAYLLKPSPKKVSKKK